MCQAEDIYQKLVKVQPTIMRKDKGTAEELAAVWEGTETAKHNAGPQGEAEYRKPKERSRHGLGVWR